MKDIKTTCKIALVQAEPVMFSKSASLKKALQYICEAASQKPDLIVFPELFIPGYPVGMNFGFSMEYQGQCHALSNSCVLALGTSNCISS